MFAYADPRVSPLWLPKHDLKKNDTNRRANMDRGMLTRPQLETKNQGQLRNAESEKIALFQGKKRDFSIPLGRRGPLCWLVYDESPLTRVV